MQNYWLIYAIGISYGLSLIVVIGAQNAFVLRQGLRKSHSFLVASLCAGSDALLILLGTLGFGWFRDQALWLYNGMMCAAGLFVLFYGLSILWKTRGGTSDKSLTPSHEVTESWWVVTLKCIAFTWLNPHVYTDTVVLLGSIAHSYHPLHWYFAAGAMTASLVFFFSLAYLPQLFSRYLSRPRVWIMIDRLIGLVMVGTGAWLLHYFYLNLNSVTAVLM